jgi:hypothetical protein
MITGAPRLPEGTHHGAARRPKTPRQTAPFTALLSDIQNCVQHLQVVQTHVAMLHRQRILDPLILRFRDLHPQTLKQINRGSNTP